MPKLYTIGHSTHPMKNFIQMLQAWEINLLIDIRTIPKSSYVPWFNSDSLKTTLNRKKIRYLHFPKLGGLRKPKSDSINQGWHNAAFRGFADYMQTPEFFSALKELNQQIKTHQVAIMCAEAVPWRCHRSLIADAEITRGIRVFDIMSPTNLHEHHLTPFAIIDRHHRPIKIYYPLAIPHRGE